MKQANVAFLGGIYPDDTQKCQLSAKASLDYAADAYQKKYLSAFLEHGVRDVKIFSVPFYGSWPRRSKLIYVSEKGESSYGNVEYVDYLNIIGLRDISKLKNTVKAVRKWYMSVSDSKPVLYTYSDIFSSVILKLKRKCKNLKIISIIPDLPQFTYLDDQSALRRFIRNGRTRTFEKSCKKTDLCICITDDMKRYIEEKTGLPCTVVEGIANKKRCEENLARINQPSFETEVNEVPKIVYTGTLARKYGILDLVNAFVNDKELKCELVICGGGDAEKEISAAAERDSRIRFLGTVSNNVSKEIQNSASVLVNPRQATDEYTRYSFPSKTMEYLETGNPVVCYKLPGIPDEYDDKLIYIDDGNGSDALLAALKKAIGLSWEERRNIQKNNLVFLINKKSGAGIIDTLAL